MTNYLGDLSPVAFAPSETHWSAGLVYKYNVNWNFNWRGAITTGEITGADARNNLGQPFRIRRNLSFRTQIIEASLIGEFNILGWQGDRYQKNFTPFVEAGLGFFHFNPQAYYQGQWYNLQEIGTEGQGLSIYRNRPPYRLTQLCIPLGLGVKVRLSEHWSVTADCALRKTFTDYLDDVSTSFPDRAAMLAEKGQLALDLSDRSFEVVGDSMKQHFSKGQMRGDPSKKDWYFFPGITITYTIAHSRRWMELHGLNPDECPSLRGK
mgnify:FL=1